MLAREECRQWPTLSRWSSERVARDPSQGGGGLVTLSLCLGGLGPASFQASACEDCRPPCHHSVCKASTLGSLNMDPTRPVAATVKLHGL